MAAIIWAPQAIADLERLLAYIAADSSASARRCAQQIVVRVDQLIEHPLSGAVIPEDDDGVYRQILQGNYRVIYRVEGAMVFIVAVHHAARLLRCDELP